jgi:hypothetical protein
VALNRNKIFLIILIALALFLIGCNVKPEDSQPEPIDQDPISGDLCAPDNVATSAAPILELMTKFDDGSDLAANTPLEQLTGPIADLQAVRRDAENLAVPECLLPLKLAQVDYMNSVIDTMLMFLSMEQEEVIMVGIEITDELRAFYEDLVIEIIGETP